MTAVLQLATTRRLPVRRWVPYVVFIVACLLSATASWYVYATTRLRAQAILRANHARFLNDAEKTREQLEFRVNTYIEVLRAGAALLAARTEISPVDFRSFVAGLQLPERYRGMEAIGFAQRVEARNLAEFRREATLDGITRLRGWRPESKLEYYPALFLEPRNAQTWARELQDLTSDSTVMATVERARDMGEPAASGEIAGGIFLVVVPVYRLRAPLDTLQERRAALVGVVFSLFKANSLLEEVEGVTTPEVAFEVYDGSSPSSKSLLGDPIEVPLQSYESVQHLRVAGREWTMVVRPATTVVATASSAARWTLIAGLALSLMLFGVTYAQVRAWESIAKHEAELRASEQALRESEAEARAAGRAKDEFLATLSHELRTPLNAILGWVSMLRLGSLQEDRRDHALAVIERNARLQAELIEDLLDISRIIMGKVRLRLRPTSATPIIKSVVDSLRPSAEAKAVQLHARISADALIRADAERVQQIVWNLVSNAIKFTPAGGHVYVELTADAYRARLAVRDTGIGIAPEFLPHVFERFRQADSSSTRPHTGLGLGLAIVQQLVELHGGDIVAHSEGLNCGSEFVARFPIATSTDTSPVPVVVRDPRSPAMLDGLRVLVVDDDPGALELLSEALGATGARVTSASSASDAMQILTEAGADVLISDLAMPDEDGYSLVRRIRALPGEIGKIPAIALTSFARADDRQRAMEAGYQVHLAKPVELSELETAIAQVTGG